MVGLKISDVETREYGAGHVAIEFWDNNSQKWAMCDVQAGIIPTSGGVALSVVELGQELSQGSPVGCMPVKGSRFSVNSPFANTQAYTTWIKEYLYFYDTPTEVTLSDIDRQKQQIAMLVPIGIESPKMFQNMFEMNAVYTHSVIDFYPKM